ncbi:hypothetical protein [Corynebacterium mastitidis]|uniref:hypothetical protein n=1 Tax=Corynebacterium mastitidis TaxID=161890 RepID=UPI0030E8E6F4
MISISKKYRSIMSTAAAAMVVVGGIVVAGVESAHAAGGCHIRTDVPDAANDATVGRVGCSNSVWGTGRIKEDRNNFPDDVVGSKGFMAGVAIIYGSCGNGKGKYYSEFSSSSGAFGQSSRTTTCL